MSLCVANYAPRLTVIGVLCYCVGRWVLCWAVSGCLVLQQSMILIRRHGCMSAVTVESRRGLRGIYWAEGDGRGCTLPQLSQQSACIAHIRTYDVWPLRVASLISVPMLDPRLWRGFLVAAQK